MSLFADLLLRRVMEPRIPFCASVRVHKMDDSAGRCNATEKGNENNARIRAANVAKVRQSIADGHGSLVAISQDTGLSYTTVRRIATELCDSGVAKRVLRVLTLTTAD